jgi:uncharacterized Zn finger protein
VVLDYLAHVKQSRTIPTVTEQDHRLQLLESTAEIKPAPRRLSRKAAKAAVSAWPEFLEQQTKPQLLALLKDLAQRNPEVRQCLREGGQVPREARGRGPDPLVKALRAEIAALSEEPGWRHHGSGEGSIPDYSRVRDRLEALLAQGHADAVVDLGAELLEAGTRQVEMSDDEGETAEEIASCLDIVFRALPRSSRSPAEQMRWAVEADLSDECELCRGAKAFWERRHPATA